MGGKRAVSRLAIVLGLTVLGNVAVSGVAAAASQACGGRNSPVCVNQTHNTRGTTTIIEETSSVAPVADAPVAVSAPAVSKGSTKAPAALKSSVATASAIRADHKKKDSDDVDEEADEHAEEADEHCGEDDIGDAPDADDDDEDCISATPTPEPTVPPEEVCGDGIDNNEDGEVDEDCETPAPPGPPAPPAPPAAPKGPVVLPRQIDRLPTTGADVTSLFLIGLTLVAIGGATRIRTSPLRVIFAGQGSAAELILIQYMNHVATQRSVRRRRT